MSEAADPHGALEGPELGVYRTPGRVAPEPIERPRLRWLLPSLGVTAATTAGVTVALVLLNALGGALMKSNERFVPTVESGEDAIAVALLATVPWLLVLVVRRLRRRLRPGEHGATPRLARGLGHAVLVIAAQLVLVGGGELAILTARGGLKLFEPTHRSSVAAPDGGTAHVYAGGLLGCRYDVYVSGPLSPIMEKRVSLDRATCSDSPVVHFEADRSITLLGRDGKPLASQPSSWPFLLGGGC